MKKTLSLTSFVLIFLILACRKESKKGCDWFPLTEGENMKYTWCQWDSTSPTPVCTDKSFTATATSISFHRLLFEVKDCSSGKVYFDHGPSNERLLLFDRNQTGNNVVIADTLFHNIRHIVTQTNTGGHLLSTVREIQDVHEEFKGELTPGVGISAALSISSTTGDTIYIVTPRH